MSFELLKNFGLTHPPQICSWSRAAMAWKLFLEILGTSTRLHKKQRLIGREKERCRHTIASHISRQKSRWLGVNERIYFNTERSVLCAVIGGWAHLFAKCRQIILWCGMMMRTVSHTNLRFIGNERFWESFIVSIVTGIFESNFRRLVTRTVWCLVTWAYR